MQLTVVVQDELVKYRVRRPNGILLFCDPYTSTLPLIGSIVHASVSHLPPRYMGAISYIPGAHYATAVCWHGRDVFGWSVRA